MSKTKYILTGVKEIDRRLLALPATLERKVIRKALRNAAKPIQAAVKQIAPKQSGQLKKAVKVRAYKKSRKGFGFAVRLGAGDFKGDTFYGAFQEYGWKTGSRKSQNRKQVEGKHFMLKTYEARKDGARLAAMEEIKKGIDVAVAELRKQ